MNFSSVILIIVVVLALVPEPGICNKKSDALVRSLWERKSFGLAGGIQNGTERTLSTRTAPDLNSFVVTTIQSSATLSQADRQTLLSDFFSLINKNGAMSGLLKDLFISPAPVPPTPPKCEKSVSIDQYNPVAFTSDGYPNNYPSDKLIDCTYVVTPSASSTSEKFYINFPNDIEIDSNKASLKIYDGSSTNSPLLIDVKTAEADTIPQKIPSTAVVTYQFKSEIGAIGKWKFTITS